MSARTQPGAAFDEFSSGFFPVSVNRFSVLGSSVPVLSASGVSVSNSLVPAQSEVPRVWRISSASGDLGAEVPIVLSCEIDGRISSTAMVDCGATSQFMDRDFAIKHGIKLDVKPVAETLTLVDGSLASAGMSTHTARVKLLLDQHQESLVFQITKLGGYPLILGRSWLSRHNPEIDWARNGVTFKSGYC